MPVAHGHVCEPGALHASRRYVVRRLTLRPESLNRAVRHADAYSAIWGHLVVHVAGEIASARDVSEGGWQKKSKRTIVRDFHGTGRRVKPDVRRQLHAS